MNSSVGFRLLGLLPSPPAGRVKSLESSAQNWHVAPPIESFVSWFPIGRWCNGLSCSFQEGYNSFKTPLPPIIIWNSRWANGCWLKGVCICHGAAPCCIARAGCPISRTRSSSDPDLWQSNRTIDYFPPFDGIGVQGGVGSKDLQTMSNWDSPSKKSPYRPPDFWTQFAVLIELSPATWITWAKLGFPYPHNGPK